MLFKTNQYRNKTAMHTAGQDFSKHMGVQSEPPTSLDEATLAVVRAIRYVFGATLRETVCELHLCTSCACKDLNVSKDCFNTCSLYSIEVGS